MTTDNPDPLEALAEELCAERCAQAGDPPCSRVSSDPHCDECQGMAKRVAQHYAPVIAENERLREEVEKWLLQPEQGGKTRYQLAEGVRAILGGKAMPPESPHELVLTPLHIKLLKRGVQSKWIGLSDNSGVRVGEVVALGELKRAGLVRMSEEVMPPGPPVPRPFEITDEGRRALGEKS